MEEKKKEEVEHILIRAGFRYNPDTGTFQDEKIYSHYEREVFEDQVEKAEEKRNRDRKNDYSR